MELAILSPDNFPLLDKMRKDLIEVGYENDEWWNKIITVRQTRGMSKISALIIYDDRTMCLYSSVTIQIEQVTLTPDNYNQILTRCKEAINK